MKIEYDANKSDKNARERGLSFDLVGDFEWETATFEEDIRKPYPEKRYFSLGYIGSRLYFVCFTPIEGGIRVISFRKANKREVVSYEKKF